MKKTFNTFKSLLIFLICLIQCQLSYACSVCFGDPNSSLSKGAVAGVVFLLIVIVCVLVGFASTFIVWAKRAKKLEKDQEALLGISTKD